jgi:two-component system NtrC family sensor kinase
MIRNSLKFRLGLYLVAVLTLVALLFTLIIVRNNREELLQQAVSHAAQLSEAITKSTHFAMMQNMPSFVDEIIEDVGAHPDIDRVRILSKNGTIIHSSLASEIGAQVDQEAESCLACHLDEDNRQKSAMIGRPRIFTDASGRRLLGTTAVIRNEAACSNSGCHFHDANQSVLGVLDIVYPLKKIDQAMRTNTLTTVGLALIFIFAAALLVSTLVNRMVYLPLRDLQTGAGTLAAGNLENKIPVRSNDELGQLANSFNSMTAALRKSRGELKQWGRTLEDKVEEATGELRLAQAEAARGEKLASVGLLAAGIAHELNNPLTGVLTFTHLVRKQMPDGSPEAEDLDLVIRETKRCATIIRRLLDFAREKTPEKKFSDINALLEESIQLIEQAVHGEDIDLLTDLDHQLPAIWIDEDLIKQVFMNILVNAQHAVDGQGRISVRTRLRTEHTPADAQGQLMSMVEISISDNGCGISNDHLQRIFDPFFTTKGVGKGTGLGLSVSHGTILAHGGDIEVESTFGEGTEFRILLPIESAGTRDNNGSDR